MIAKTLIPTVCEIEELINKNKAIEDDYGCEEKFNGYFITETELVFPFKKGFLQYCYPLYIAGDKLKVNTDSEAHILLFCPKHDDEYAEAIKSHNEILDTYHAKGSVKDQELSKHKIKSFKFI